MKILRHTENTVANLEKLVDDYHEGMELLSTVLSTIQISLIRGSFTGMPDLEGWTRIVDKFTQCHSKIHSKIRANPVRSQHPKTEDCEHSVVQDQDEGAVCGKCSKDLGWYCQISPKHFCEYGNEDECCIHCGAPEERQ